MGAVEEMVCVGVVEGHSGDGCALASTLCKYDLRWEIVCSELGKGKYLFGAANVWWGVCAVFCYCLLWQDA